MDFPVYNRDLDRILRTEGTKVGARIGDVTSASPTQGTILMSTTFVTGGTFTKFIKRFYITASVDCEILLNIRLANGFVNESNQDLKGVTNNYIQLKADVMMVYEFNEMLLYNQVVQFIFQKYRGAGSGSVNLTVSWSGYEIFMNRNYFAPLGVKILADSIGAGANSSTTNTKPYGSWFSQIVFSHYGATQDVKGIQKAVGGVTASGIDQASMTGFSYCDNANLILIGLGTNPDTSDALFRSSIESIIARERVYHPQAWIVVCNPIVKDSAGEAQNVVYRSILADIVNDLANPRILLLPFEELGILPGVIPSDVHPNQAGHDAMYSFARTFLLANNVTI